jgi:hypothetical protein
MPMEFQDDPSAPGRRVWRRPGGPAIQSGVGVLILGIVTLIIAAIPLLMGIGSMTLPLALWLALLVLFSAALTLYCWRDMRGKRGGVIVLDETGIILDLPAGRSLLHRPPACRETVPYADVVAVETRLEAYHSQAMTMMQRAYRLTRRSGAALFLFEERALSAQPTASYDVLAGEIARRAGAPLKDLGVVLGGGGILGAWFVRVPDWSTPSVPPGEEVALVRRARLTGAFAVAALGIVIVIVVISYL